jgi:hypothetical protein
VPVDGRCFLTFFAFVCLFVTSLVVCLFVVDFHVSSYQSSIGSTALPCPSLSNSISVGYTSTLSLQNTHGQETNNQLCANSNQLSCHSPTAKDNQKRKLLPNSCSLFLSKHSGGLAIPRGYLSSVVRLLITRNTELHGRRR